MPKRKLLFSAPFRFLTKEIEEYKKYFIIDFCEIWSKEELEKLKLNYEFWIPNPGQNFMVDGKILNNFHNLKIVSTPSTGTNHINIKDCEDHSVRVYGLLDNRPQLNKISASAEFTFLKLLASIRKIDLAWSEIRDGRWRHNEDELRGHEIKELSYGFIGMGRIGTNLVRYLKAFDAKRIAYYDPNVSLDDYSITKVESIEKVFAESDVVTICAVLNDETNGIITFDQLRLMKKNSFLINTSRGELINEDDLVRTLEERKDISFSADVIVGEVINEHMSNPLVELHKSGKIKLTPHIAGATYGSQTHAAITAFENILKNA